MRINWNFYTISFTENNKQGGNEFIKKRWNIFLNTVTSQKTDKIRKKIIQFFRDNGFSIDIVTNLVENNFLEVTYNLIN